MLEQVCFLKQNVRRTLHTASTTVPRGAATLNSFRLHHFTVFLKTKNNLHCSSEQFCRKTEILQEKGSHVYKNCLKSRSKAIYNVEVIVLA